MLPPLNKWGRFKIHGAWSNSLLITKKSPRDIIHVLFYRFNGVEQSSERRI